MRVSSCVARAAAMEYSSQRLIEMSFHAVSNFGYPLLRVLKKVGCSAVSFERGIVFVLLVNEEPARLGLVAVHQIHYAAGFFARLLRQFGKDSRHLSFAPQFRQPGYSQDNHGTLHHWILAEILVLLPV